MFHNKILRKIIKLRFDEIDQTRLLYVLSILVGLLSALAAVALKNTVHFTSRIFTERIVSESGSLLYLAFPLLGIVLTVFFVKYVVKDNISHGISRVLFAISKKNSKIKAHNTWSSIVASTLTIGFGGSVGAEAPIVLSGSAIGSSIGRFFKLNYRSVTLLVGCGAAGAVAAIFKAPIAGIVFTLEILMLDLTMSSIVPLMISAVTATTVAYFLMGEEVMFTFNVESSFNMANIPWYLILGLVAGLVSIYFSKLTLYLERWLAKITNQYFRMIFGGIVLGLLIFLFPPLYGEGYNTIMILLQGGADQIFNESIFSNFSSSYLGVLLFMLGLVIFKVFASSATNGAGGVGGVFAPTLFLGGVCGFLVSGVLSIFFNVEIPDSRFVLAGMAGLMAGVMHAPLTAIFLIAEITGGYNFLIPLIITSTVSYITTRSVIKHSIYHIQLAQRGELITHDKDKAVLTVMDWRKEIERDLVKVGVDDSLGTLVKAISSSTRNIFPVVDKYNVLEGMVLLDDVRELMFDQEKYETYHVRDFMILPPSYIDQSEGIETVMETFRKTGAWNLPVLKDGYYVGFISKSRIYAKYRELVVQFSEE
jgi:CIC family chloride channel protein